MPYQEVIHGRRPESNVQPKSPPWVTYFGYIVLSFKNLSPYVTLRVGSSVVVMFVLKSGRGASNANFGVRVLLLRSWVIIVPVSLIDTTVGLTFSCPPIRTQFHHAALLSFTQECCHFVLLRIQLSDAWI